MIFNGKFCVHFEERRVMDSGIVFIGTPIGDTEDISAKALNYLKKIKLFFCEDTRKSKDILVRLGVDIEGAKFKSLHDHSGQAKIDELIQIANTDLIGYLSDAGSPLISDPAFPIVEACLKNGITYKFVSGITAPIYALENSGLPPIPFMFHGFLPREKGKINTILENLPKGTHIFFEGVSRVEKTLKNIAEALPEVSVVVARECTKTHESFYRFKARDYQSVELTLKGEFVILLHQMESSQISAGKSAQLAQEVFEQGPRPKLVAKLIAEILGKNPKEVYQQLSRN